jgi:hypothetical protein
MIVLIIGISISVILLICNIIYDKYNLKQTSGKLNEQGSLHTIKKFLSLLPSSFDNNQNGNKHIWLISLFCLNILILIIIIIITQDRNNFMIKGDIGIRGNKGVKGESGEDEVFYYCDLNEIMGKEKKRSDT